MKLILAAVLVILVVETSAQWYKFPGQAARGAVDMAKAYRDMRKANWKNSDKYFHARGNFDAAERGAGGKWTAKVISNGREWTQEKMGHHASDIEADQFANRWGREGRDPNYFRPKGLPKKY